MKDYQSQVNDARAEADRERGAAIGQAMESLGLDPDDDDAYGVLAFLYDQGETAGQQWEYSYPS